MTAEFFLAAGKPQREEGGRRILLGDDTGGGAIKKRPFRFQGGSLSHPQIYHHICVYINILNSGLRRIRFESKSREWNYYVKWEVFVITKTVVNLVKLVSDFILCSTR